MNSPLNIPNEEFFAHKNYPQRGGVQNNGKLYEYAITSLIALRATLDDDVLDMWVASNVDSLGAFDDLVLFTDHKQHGKRITVAQLTHKDQKNYVLNQKSFMKRNEKFCLETFEKDYNDIKFCLHQFDKNYNNLDQNLGKKYKTTLDVFGDIGVNDTDFIIYTNNDLESDESEFTITEDVALKRIQPAGRLSILNTGIDGGRVYQIYCNPDKDDFYSKFHLFARQSRLDDVESLIYSEIHARFGEVHNSIAKDILSFFQSWATGELIDHYHLTKKEIKVKLFELLISPYIIKPCLMGRDYETTIWRQLLDMVDFVILEDETEAINSYAYFALEEIVNGYYDEKFIHLDKWDVRFTTDVVAHVKSNTVIKKWLDKMTGVNTPLTCELFYKTLWKMGVIPLVINVDNDFLSKLLTTLHINEDYKLRLIVMRSKFGELNESSYKIFKSLSDISTEVVADITDNLLFSLQGRIKVSLKELNIDEDKNILSSISATTVLKMLAEEYVIGKINEEEFYVDRHLSEAMLRIDVLEKAHGQLFVISGDLNLKETDRFNVVDYDDLKDFEATNKNVATFHNYEYIDDHILKKFNSIHNLLYDESCSDAFKWKKTYGSISPLLDFVKQIPVPNEENTNGRSYVPRTGRKINVINGDPGIGKSAFMRKIASDCNIYDWIFLVTLNDITNELNALKTTVNALEYFYNKIEVGGNPLARAVFEVFKSRKWITVLFDGFDEISPMYTDTVTDIVKWFERNGYTIWVSSRPVMKKHLELSFNTLSFSLQPFSDHDVDKYIQGYEADQEKCSSLVRNVKTIFGDKIECMRNPLLLKVAVGYVQSNLFDKKDVDIVDLYEHFVNEMLELYWKKSHLDSTNNYAMDVMKSNNPVFKEMCVKVSLILLFGDKLVEEVTQINEVEEFLKELQKGHKGIGIIVDVTENLTPVFCHRTFAEYLTGKWLAESIKNDKIKKLLPTLFSPGFVFIKEVFDRILGKGLQLHNAIINLDVDFVRNYSNVQIDEKDWGGRTPLHLAASRGQRHYHATSNSFDIKVAEHYTENDVGKNEEIFKILLEKGANPDHLDTFMKWNAFNYAARMSCLNLIEILYDRGYHGDVSELMPAGSLAFFCFDKNYIKIAEKMDGFPFIQTMENNQNPVHITSINGNAALLQLYFKKSKYVVVDAKDGLGNTALHYAAQNGHNNCIEILLENGADIHIKNEGVALIAMAALHGKASTIIYLKSKGVNMDELDVDQRSPLHYAASGGNVYCVNLLISEGCEVDAVDSNGWTPLQLAAVAGHEDVVEYLLEKDAEVNRSNHGAETALYLAAKCGHVHCVSLLLKFGANYDLKCHNLSALDVAASKRHLECVKILGKYPIHLNNAFHLALENCDVDCVNCLLDIGIDVNAQSNHGTPLFHTLASQIENVSIIAKLIQKGADINEKCDGGDSPLHKAAATSNVQELKLLVKHGADARATNHDGMTPLHTAIKWFSEESSLVLLEQNIDINAQNKTNSTPLHLASCSINTLSVAKILLNKGAAVTICDSRGRIPLHFAAKVGDFDYVHDLISKNSDVNKTCNNGVSPLHLATIGNHKGVVQLLIDKNADVNAQTQSGASPLHWACYNGAAELAIILLDNHASINEPSKQGFTPLDHAVLSGDTYLIQHLKNNDAVYGSAEISASQASDLKKTFLRHKKEIRQKSTFDKLISWTDMHFAAKVNYAAYVPYLVDIIDETNDDGATALHIASEEGHVEFVGALATRGANLNVSCKMGLTPLDLAKRNKREGVVEILENASTQMVPT